MTKRFLTALLALFALLLAAFSTASAAFLVPAALLAVLMISGAVGMWHAAATLQVEAELSAASVQRGESVTLRVTVRHGGWLPVAPLEVELCGVPDQQSPRVRLQDAPGRRQQLTLPVQTRHVGVSHPGVKTCVIEDLFGLYRAQRQTAGCTAALLVLPAPFPVDELVFAPGDSGLETMARATEDVTSPSDVRAYQPGDALKKIHWKLSLRKNELMVRRFEEPMLPDALVLMDCSAPPDWGHPEAAADVRDALLETAAAVMESQLTSDHAVRLPVMGAHPVELEKGMGMPLVLEYLARVDFSETDRFERVLLMESRRLRRVGSTVIISARLNGSIVDAMIRMRRMGPNMRLYLVTFTPDDPQLLPMIGKLQHAMIEVCYVTPVAA